MMNNMVLTAAIAGALLITSCLGEVQVKKRKEFKKFKMELPPELAEKAYYMNDYGGEFEDPEGPGGPRGRFPGGPMGPDGMDGRRHEDWRMMRDFDGQFQDQEYPEYGGFPDY